jgi:hypothetical protein
MTVETDPQLFGPAARTGVVADRQLIAVQTLHIGRLTSDPLPIRPSSFVMVSGRGPTDSNNSGKTTFLASLALLLGDPLWRLSGPAVRNVADLLFDPRAVDGLATGYDAADHAYIVGLFARDGGADPVTVWVRLNRSSPYLRIRWQDDEHLAAGATDSERHQAADDVWAALPAHWECGAEKMAQILYGEQTRCLAYVTDRGAQQAGPSLLQMNAGGLKPEQIASSLIELVGRAGFFEQDTDQRRVLAEHRQRLQERRTDDERRFAVEETELGRIDGRTRARTALAEACSAWQLHFARGLLEAWAAVTAADEQMAEAETAADHSRRDLAAATEALTTLGDGSGLHRAAEEAGAAAGTAQEDWQAKTIAATEARSAADEIARRHQAALDQADGWTGPGPGECELAVAQALAAKDEAQRAAGAAEAESKQARLLLDELRAEGTAGLAARAAIRLRQAGIPCRPLLDTEPLDSDRQAWEARLAPWRDCLIVEGDVAAALREVTDLPGAMLAQAQDGPLPAGLASAPDGAGVLLAALVDDAKAHGPGARHDRLGVTVVAGFDPPLSGRVARLRAAEHRLQEAEQQAAEANEQAKLAVGAVTDAESDLARSQAAVLAEQLNDAVEQQRHEAEAGYVAAEKSRRR